LCTPTDLLVKCTRTSESESEAEVRAATVPPDGRLIAAVRSARDAAPTDTLNLVSSPATAISGSDGTATASAEDPCRPSLKSAMSFWSAKFSTGSHVSWSAPYPFQRTLRGSAGRGGYLWTRRAITAVSRHAQPRPAVDAVTDGYGYDTALTER
jgi:hypothetical protein